VSANLSGDRRRKIKGQKFGGRRFMLCHYCGVAVRFDTSTLDHMIPIAEEGTHDPSNLVICCLKCNMRKADQPYAEFKQLMLAEKQARKEVK